MHHTAQFENGVYISHLAQSVRKTSIKKSSKPFTLQNINKLRDFPNKETKLANWEILAGELKKFGIKLSREKVERIVGGDTSLIIEIISKLKSYHETILKYPTIAGPQKLAVRLQDLMTTPETLARQEQDPLGARVGNRRRNLRSNR